MRLRSVPPLLASLGFILSVPLLRADDDPGSAFLQAYQEYQTAAKLEANGKLDDAMRKYRFCAGLLEQLQKQDPEFQPVVIDYRLKKSRESIARVQSLTTPEPSASVAESAPVPPPSRPAPPPRPSQLLLDVPAYRLPVPGGGSTAQQSAPSTQPTTDFALSTPGDEVIGRGALAELKKQLRAMQFRLDAEKQENASLRDQLLGSKANEQSALV